MNQQIRSIERESGLEIYGLGLDRPKWEAAMTKFAELIVRESIKVIVKNDYHGEWLGERVKEHFGVEE